MKFIRSLIVFASLLTFALFCLGCGDDSSGSGGGNACDNLAGICDKCPDGLVKQDCQVTANGFPKSDSAKCQEWIDSYLNVRPECK